MPGRRVAQPNKRKPTMNITCELDDEEADTLDVVFPGGPVLPDRNEVLDGAMKTAGYEIGRVLKLRSDAAISGAMRWPWSQEAALHSLTRVAYK